MNRNYLMIHSVSKDTDSHFDNLQETWSNESFAHLPTNITAANHELDVNNLKPDALYEVYSLITFLELDRPATLNTSPIPFKTKCRGRLSRMLSTSESRYP